MDAYSYLSVLLSIILGLAVTQVLQGYRALLLARAHVQLYAPPLIWSALMLVIAMQNWWSSFGLADHHNWSFVAFSVVALQTVLLYMMAALVLPDIPAGETLDLRLHYHREAPPFFALTLAMLTVSIGKEYVLDGRLPQPLNLAFHLIYAALATIALVTRSPRYHRALAWGMIAYLGAYIGLLFAAL